MKWLALNFKAWIDRWREREVVGRGAPPAEPDTDFNDAPEAQRIEDLDALADGQHARWPGQPASPQRLEMAGADQLAAATTGRFAPARSDSASGLASAVSAGATAADPGREPIAAPPGAMTPPNSAELAQWSGADPASSGPRIRVTEMPPWSLAGGGLALGAGTAALAGGGGGGSSGGGGGGGGGDDRISWSGGSMTVAAPAGTVTTIDAAAAGDGAVLTIIGGGSVIVTDMKGSSSIDARALSGELVVTIADDGRLTHVQLATGSARTTIHAMDPRDHVTVDAGELPNGERLLLTGRVDVAQVLGLMADLDAAALTQGRLNVATAPGSGAPRPLSVQTGSGETNVASQAGDTIAINAEALADGVRLSTSGAGNIQITNLSGDLFNTATGAVSVTLDHDAAAASSISTRIDSATAITVNNGALDGNDTIVITGPGTFTVNSLVANLNASGVSPVAQVSVNLGSTASAQSLDFGPGQTELILGGRTVGGSLTNLDRIDVRAGGDLSAAGIQSSSGTPVAGTISGTRIDFADANVTLTVSVAQHNAIRDTILLDASGLDSGSQTLKLSEGVQLTSAIAGIDTYELASGGTRFGLTLDNIANATSVQNDVRQNLAGTRLFRGSDAGDAFRTSESDLIRGALTVETGSGQDFHFVRNFRLGNQGSSGLASSGFGGGLVELSPQTLPGVFTNYGTFGETVSLHWTPLFKSAASLNSTISGGIRPVTIQNFDISADRVVYLEGTTDVSLGNRYFTVGASGQFGAEPPHNSVIEIESTYAPWSDAATDVGTDPRALDKIATLLTTLPPIEDSSDVGNSYYVIVYSRDLTQAASQRDAWLYAATASQDDGFDFVEDVTRPKRDTDTLELIGVFKGLGLDAFNSQHFV